jgi:hypothetical protein
MCGTDWYVIMASVYDRASHAALRGIAPALVYYQVQYILVPGTTICVWMD